MMPINAPIPSVSTRKREMSLHIAVILVLLIRMMFRKDMKKYDIMIKFIHVRTIRTIISTPKMKEYIDSVVTSENITSMPSLEEDDDYNDKDIVKKIGIKSDKKTTTTTTSATGTFE